MQNPDAEQAIKSDLDRCVKCGMCLPECPTYRLETNENESPRGRLALIEGLISGQLPRDAAMARHLDSCLACRRCERVCPSQVPYGRLIDAARERLYPGRTPRLGDLLRRPALLRTGLRLARAIPGAVSRPVPPLHRLHAAARALTSTGPAPAPGDYAPFTGRPRGRVGLFAGCIGRVQQGGAIASALRLLRHCGFNVWVPEAQPCCGALARHAGDADAAERLATGSRALFGREMDAVVSLVSGCGVHLDDYQPPLPAPHFDIHRFLLERGGLRPSDFSPLARDVALHSPCSVENVYRGAQWVSTLLELIPGLQIEPIGVAGQCCGAAGDYMLRRPQTAARLRSPLVEQTLDNGHTLLLTANVGCAMHLAAGLRERGAQVEVLHPVDLLARQLLDRAS